MKNIKIPDTNSLQLFQLIRFCALILSGILLAKSGLGRTFIGQYETFILIAGAFSLFGGTSVLNNLITLSSNKSLDQIKVIVFNSFMSLLIFSFIAAILFYSLSTPISEFLLNGNIVPMPTILSIYILINTPGLLVEYIYLLNNRSKNIMVYGTVTFVLQALAVGIPPYFGFEPNTILQGLLFISIVKLCWLVIVLKYYAKAKLEISIIKHLLHFSDPLIFSTLLYSSLSYINGFIVTSKFSPDELAIFQFGTHELPLAFLLSNSLCITMLPRLKQKNIESPLVEFRSEVYRLIWFLFPISLVLILTSHLFFPLVFSPQFKDSAVIFNISLLLVICRVLFPQTLLNAKKMNTIIVWSSFMQICINVVCSIWLVSYLGIAGVAYGTLIASICDKLFLIFACKRKLKISLFKYLPVRIYTFSTILLILAFIMVEFILY